MIFLQLALFCLLFTGIVKLSVLGGAVNGLFFSRFKRFMALFYIVMAVALILIVGLWNRASDFRTAYFQTLLFLEIMNWYDGLVIDKLWVGHSKFWVIPGLEDIPFVQTWSQMLKKRLTLTLIWAITAASVAGLILLLFR